MKVRREIERDECRNFWQRYKIIRVRQERWFPAYVGNGQWERRKRHYDDEFDMKEMNELGFRFVPVDVRENKKRCMEQRQYDYSTHFFYWKFIDRRAPDEGV